MSNFGMISNRITTLLTMTDLLLQRENAVFTLEIVGNDGLYFELSSTEVTSEASLSLKVKSDEELDYEAKNNLDFKVSRSLTLQC